MTRERLIEIMHGAIGHDAELYPNKWKAQLEAAADAILAEMAAGDTGCHAKLEAAARLLWADARRTGDHTKWFKSISDIAYVLEEIDAIRALRRPDAAPVPEKRCECFGDTGLHASTHGGADGRRYCDLCGRPVADGSTDVLTAVNNPDAAPEAEPSFGVAMGRLRSPRARGRPDAAPARPVCQACGHPLAVETIRGTHGLCVECAPRGFPRFCRTPPATPSVEEVTRAMRALSPDERMRAMGEFCKHCGADDPRCQCWNDE